ncbi:MAG: amidohydrolase family protein [Streptosporangiaceae bacterium]
MTDGIRGRVVIVEAGAPVRRHAVIELDGGRIAGVRDATAEDDGPVYDVVLPGLVDAHSHARGVPLACHGVGDGPLERFLLEMRALTPLPAADEALVAGAAALATGITSVQAIYHTFADAAQYALGAAAVADGYLSAGLRAFIALGLTDQDEFVPGAADSGSTSRDMLTPRRGVTPGAFPALAAGLLGTRGLVSIDAVGPVAPQWCSDRALRAIAEVGGATRLHAHLLESARQRLAPADPLARLARAGLLSARCSFAHGVWLDARQIDRVAAAGATIVHCPGSNARLADATCPVRRLIDAGVPVALGLDSHGAVAEPDAFAEMRLALRMAARAGAPLTAAEVLALATTGGAAAVARRDLGTLRPGAAADIVAVNLPEAATAADPVEDLVIRAGPANVAATWVAGRPARQARAAAAARVRLAAALADDAAARAERVAEAQAAWEAADRGWRELEARGRVGA